MADVDGKWIRLNKIPYLVVYINLNIYYVIYFSSLLCLLMLTLKFFNLIYKQLLINFIYFTVSLTILFFFNLLFVELSRFYREETFNNDQNILKNK